MQLPYAFSPNWYLHDYRSLAITSRPAAGGIATAELAMVPQDEIWMVERAVVKCNSTSATAAFFYVNDVDDRNYLDGTRVGNFDVCDNASPLMLRGGDRFLCRWSGASAGAVGWARLQLRILKQAAT